MTDTWFEEYAASHTPDFKVGPPEDPYMLRWFLTPRGENGGVYLHQFLKSDDDRALHDHSYDSVSIILSGNYREHLKFSGVPRLIFAGDIVSRKAVHAHRIEVIEPGFTMFTMGSRIREWGFHCPQGWRHWTRFVDPEKPGAPGPGCDGYTTPEIERTPLK